MPALPVYIASDVHLGAIPPEREHAFLTWLEGTPGSASCVIINGDLFDFWFEYRSGIPRGYDRVLDLLRELVSSGMPVTLMGGNHDWWGGRYLRDEIGVEFLQEPVTRVLAGHRTLVAHGDGLGAGDLGYRILKLVLRGSLTRWAFAQLGPGLGGRLAGGVSKTEHRWGAPSPGDIARSRVLEGWAMRTLSERPELDLVVLGHTHIPRLLEVAPGRWYVNAGDWVHHGTYLVLERGRDPHLVTWGA